MQKLSIRCIITNHDSALLMHPLLKAIQSIFSVWWISSEPALFVHRCRKSKSRCRFRKNRWKPLPCDGEAFRKRISLNYYGQRFNKYLGHAGWSRVGEWLAGGGSDALHLLWKFISRPQDFLENHFPSYADFILDFHYRLFYKWNPHTHFSSTSATFSFCRCRCVSSFDDESTFQWKNQLEA